VATIRRLKRDEEPRVWKRWKVDQRHSFMMRKMPGSEFNLMGRSRSTKY
jgi:hypothetical protein